MSGMWGIWFGGDRDSKHPTLPGSGRGVVGQHLVMESFGAVLHGLTLKAGYCLLVRFICFLGYIG